MKCTDLDILLCEYVDGTLDDAVRAQIRLHLDHCPECAELARDAAAAAGFLQQVPVVEPPPELITRILHQTSEAPRPTVIQVPGPFDWFRRLFTPVLQPRLAMGMAMTILSFSLIGRFAGVPVRQLTAADLDPGKIWSTMDAKVHRTYDRAVKYYENLRLVFEIQSRLKEWSAEEEQDRKSQSGGQILEPKSGVSSEERSSQ